VATKSLPPSQHDMTRKRGRGSWVIDTRRDGQVVAFFRHLETNEHSWVKIYSNEKNRGWWRQGVTTTITQIRDILVYDFTLKKLVNTSYKICIRVCILTHKQLILQKLKYPYCVFTLILLVLSEDDLMHKTVKQYYVCR
jgi:hypothetical protein